MISQLGSKGVTTLGVSGRVTTGIHCDVWDPFPSVTMYSNGDAAATADAAARCGHPLMLNHTSGETICKYLLNVG